MTSDPQTLAYQALFRACIKEAASRGRTLMERLVAHALTALPQRADQANDPTEREAQLESLRLLVIHDKLLCHKYPEALLAEFAQALSANAGAKPAAAFSFDSLELMGEDQVQENVELVRAQQATAVAVESELGVLNSLICAVQGLRTVQAERNPLRPEVYVKGLRNVILETGAPPAVRLRWMQHFGEAMGRELAHDYAGLSEMLRAEGVAQAGFNVIHAPEHAAGAGLRAPGGAAHAAQAGSAAPSAQRSQTLLNVRQLRRLLAGELDSRLDAFTGRFEREFEAGDSQLPPVDFSPTVPAALETLQEMKQVDQVMQRLAERQGGAKPRPVGHGPAAVREQLRQQAKGPGQALGLEVVNLMVENIASDPRLLPPVQQTVRDLEPALLRLALTDPRFFSDRKHPARRLLDQVTQRSLAWPAVDAPGFAGFMEPLQQAVDALLETRIEGGDPFDFALQSLEEAWGDQQKRDRWYREKAVRALLQAEQRNLLAERIGKELRARPDVAHASRELMHFLTGPWSQVLAQARLSEPDGGADPGGYAEIVNDLLWSAIPEVAGNNPARLARLVPPLLEKLRAGLASIDYPKRQAQRFFDHLIALHEQAIKLPAAPAATRPVPKATRRSRAELEAEFAQAEGSDSNPWLAPAEAQQSGFLDTQQTVPPQPLFQPTQPGFDDTRPRAEADSGRRLPEPGIAPGAWVELLMDGRWVRNQLTWASPHGTLFMFTSATGSTHSMTRRLLDKMLLSGTLRLVSGQAVVDGALDAVAQAALRNSLDLNL